MQCMPLPSHAMLYHTIIGRKSYNNREGIELAIVAGLKHYNNIMEAFMQSVKSLYFLLSIAFWHTCLILNHRDHHLCRHCSPADLKAFQDRKL